MPLCGLWTNSDPAERQRMLAAATHATAKAWCFVTRQAVQLHGSMGVTDELAVGDIAVPNLTSSAPIAELLKTNTPTAKDAPIVAKPSCPDKTLMPQSSIPPCRRASKVFRTRLRTTSWLG
jgi:hypothetical protein